MDKEDPNSVGHFLTVIATMLTLGVLVFIMATVFSAVIWITLQAVRS